MKQQTNETPELAQAVTTVTGLELSPELDGVTHINFFSRGRTELGRACSNFSDCNIEHPYFGHFRTLEGLWFYLKTGRTEEMLRLLNGMDARKKGKELGTVYDPLFTKYFKLGMIAKVERNPALQRLLTETDLPFVHYYVFGTPKAGSKPAIFVPNGHEWQMEYWSMMRQSLKISHSLESMREELIRHIERTRSNRSPKD